MDLPSGGSALDPRSTASTPHSRTNPFGNPADGSRRIDGRLGDLRRGYSDEEVHSRRVGAHNRRTTDEALRDGETWMDFLRQSSNTAHSPEERAQIATRRAAIMAADRKRRLTGQQEEQARRRSSSSQSFGQTANDRMWQSVSQSTNNHPLAGPSISSDSRPGPRITDRPLPPRPLRTSSQSRRPADIRLPRWQPDAEVGRCPICNAAFNFWYRKHHCRKCGRVVCASCSPHRITIPRQFIVHSPSEYDQDHNLGGDTNGSAIIDLTSDNEDDAARPSSSSISGRRQSQHIRLDSALGGGQEVRLCNPCVPDPNPLPHVAFTPPTRYTFNSFPAPEIITRATRATQHSQQQPRLSSDLQQKTSLPSTPDFGRPYYRPSHASDSIANHERHSTSSPFVGASATSRRQSQPFQPPGVPPPPNYASIYGSVPNPSIHERFLGSLLQEHQPLHPRHRHHNSVGGVPTSSRHPSMLNVQIPSAPRAAPQPVLQEEDECPICHNALPPKGPDGSEGAREAHVAACIESHFSTSSPQTSRPHPSTATEAAVAASVATPSQAEGRSSPLATRAEGSQDHAATHLMPRRRTTGMVVYHASEKDCVNEDGEGAQECVICFEEFAVGVEMGRLECLCKFHKVCIRQWWDTKGVGACPVHQGGI